MRVCNGLVFRDGRLRGTTKEKRGAHIGRLVPAPSRGTETAARSARRARPRSQGGPGGRRPVGTTSDTRGISSQLLCSCCTTGSASSSGKRRDRNEESPSRTRTIAVSSGSTVHNIWATASSANSPHIGSSNEGGEASLDARNARTSLTRGPLPGSWMNGVLSREGGMGGSSWCSSG